VTSTGRGDGPGAARVDGPGAAGVDGPPGSPLEVVALIWERAGAFLVARTHGRDAWYLPGGKREPGETVAAALVREVREELGVVLDAASVQPILTVEAAAHGHAPGTRVQMTCCRGDVVGEPRASGEIAELAWFGPSDVPRLAPAARLAAQTLFAAP
jgi:8-oxo-dGTP pyrophosphatase MutT (NUDIX family)